MDRLTKQLHECDDKGRDHTLVEDGEELKFHLPTYSYSSTYSWTKSLAGQISHSLLGQVGPLLPLRMEKQCSDPNPITYLSTDL